MSWLSIWKLKRSLRRAAALHASGALDDARYGAFAVYAVSCLQEGHKPARIRELRGQECGWISFPVKAGVALKRNAEEWPAIDFKAAMATYGPFNHATVWVQEAIERYPGFEKRLGGFVWDENAEGLLKDALFKLSALNRAALRVEEWIVERRTRLPNVVETITTVLVIVLTAVVSFVAGRLSK